MNNRPGHVDGESSKLHCSRQACALVRFAAAELERLGRAVWAGPSAVRGGDGPFPSPAWPPIHLGVWDEDETLRALLEEAGESAPDAQGYVIRRCAVGGESALVLVGGSAAATLWAVYELAEFWGVRFLSYREIMPADPPKSSIPPGPIRREPAFATRAWRGLNVLPHSVAYWGIDDCKRMIDQLAKLRFNAYYLFLRPFDPFVDFAWAGQKKQTAMISFDERYPVRPTWVGHEKFDGESRFENPSIPSHGSYERRARAARQYADDLCEHAHARGMRFGVQFWVNEFAPEFKRRLRERSIESGFEPGGSGSGHAGRLGAWREGIDPKVSPYMSVRNEHFIGLAEAQLRGVLDGFARADFCVINHSEFAASTTDFDYAWEGLVERYPSLSSWSIDKLIDDAVHQTKGDYDPIDSSRVGSQIKSQVCVLYVLDEIFRRRGVVDIDEVGPKLIFAAADAVLPLAAHVLGSRVELLSALSGYLASDAARHTDWLNRSADTGRPLHVQLSLEDDNIGLTPQYASASIQTVMQAAHTVGGAGVWGRQWLHSKITPTIDYMAHLCWDIELEPHTRYRQLIESICGPHAVEPMLRALALAEKITDHNDRHGMGHSFLVADLLRGRWAGHNPPTPEMLGSAPLYESYTAQLLIARQRSRPDGQQWIDDMVHHARFSVGWTDVLDHTYRAGAAHRLAQERRISRDADGLDDAMQASVFHLDRAIAASSLALTHWAEALRDRSDLGALASLNHYGHEFLLAERHIVGLEASFWSCEVAESMPGEEP